MSRLRSAMLGAVLGAGAVLAIIGFRQSFEPSVGLPEATAVLANHEVPSAPAQVNAGVAVDLTPVTSRIDALAQRLQDLEAKLDRVFSAPLRTPAAGSEKLSLDADTLQSALEAVERKKIEAMSDEALRSQAWLLMKEGDSAAAVQRLQTLLARDLTPERRAEVMIELGMQYRNQGGQEGIEASERTLQAVIDTHGMDSRLGVAAAQDMVWTLAKNDAARALAVADASVRSAGASQDQRITGRWQAAIMAQKVGDVVRARADYQALLRELEGQPNREKLLVDLRDRLQKL